MDAKGRIWFIGKQRHDQHRLLAIYYLADSQLKLAEIIADQLRSSPDML